MSNLQLINMQDVELQTTKWLWEPYIPFGKICILQGDGGDGKTTAALQIAAAVSSGRLLPECIQAVGPYDIIYQTAEDGLGDTILPRLMQAHADLRRVHVIDESLQGLTLIDSRIEAAIVRTGAKVFIIDPLQAYLGATVDMHRANQIRPIMKKVGDIAEKYECAFLIIGHLNKGAGKSQYRGLGSVDIYSSARSVLTFGRIPEQPNMRAFIHTKSNLAPEGEAIAYELHPEKGFRWAGKYDVSIAELLGSGFEESTRKRTPFDRAVAMLQNEFSDQILSQEEILRKAKEQNISERTLNTAKAHLQIKSKKIGNQWFWELPQKAEDCNIAID